MAVHAFHNDLLTIDEYAIVIAAKDMGSPFLIVHLSFLIPIAMAIFDGTETEFLALYMDWLALLVLERKDSGVEVGLLGIPLLRIFDAEVHPRPIAADREGRALRHLLSLGVDDIDSY